MNINKNILIINGTDLINNDIIELLKLKNYQGNIFKAYSKDEAFNHLEKNDIELVVLVPKLLKAGGINIIRKIKDSSEDIKIIILDSDYKKQDVLKFFNLGVNACCSCPISAEKFCDIASYIMDGSIYFDADASRHLFKKANKKEDKFSTVSIKDCYNLTQQEKRVLILLSSGNNNLQIARKLEISINTTKVHVCSILQKMGVEDRTQAAIKAIRENLIKDS